MADKPILFSAPMVRALLDGRKTQTRRLMNPQPITKADSVRPVGTVIKTNRPAFNFFDGGGHPIYAIPTRHGFAGEYHARYAPGDRLYVRETCRAEELSRPPVTRLATRKERAMFKRTEVVVIDDLDGRDGIRYTADDTWIPIANTMEAGHAWSDLFYYRGRGKGSIGNMVPPIHMPRWASRITLTVTDVRVQRLQEISEADAIAEGIDATATKHFGNPVKAYAALWNSLHGAENEHSWEANPWIVAVTFDVREGNIDA